MLLPTGEHGGDAAALAAALGLDPAQMIDLSASLNPFAPPIDELVARAVAGGALRCYPDPEEAAEALATAIGVAPARLVLTNGGAEAIALVAGDVEVGNVVEPEFSLYRRHLRRVDPAAPRWRSNPSNPLGELAAADDTAAVWDEAFHPLATGHWTRGDDTSWRLGSLTKLWACPGLRLGYVIAPDADRAGRIRRRQPQWSVNGIALALLPQLLAHTDLIGWQRRIETARQAFAVELRRQGHVVRDTSVNWLLVERAGLRSELAPAGVVVRDCTSFGLPGVHRVALPAEADVGRVLDAFAGLARR